MKKSTMFFAALITMLMTTVSTFADDRVVPNEQLPAAAKAFLQKNFPGNAVSYTTIDYDNMRKMYEAHLADGTEVKFDKAGNWDKVDCHFTAVPAHLVPANIAQQVKAQYQGAVITKIDKERYGYDIELSNDLDLKFNKHGQLAYIDD